MYSYLELVCMPIHIQYEIIVYDRPYHEFMYMKLYHELTNHMNSYYE